MREVVGDLWTFPADVRVITTNGTVKLNGEAVMGRGCALEAKQRYPGLDLVLGQHVKENGNHVNFLFGRGLNGTDDIGLISFPVKHSWYEKADIELIKRSAVELVVLANMNPSHHTIVMPRPGCGNGRLSWPDVREVLAPILDDRFHVISPGGNK